MTDRFKIFGSELSPYSVKVRSYFRYKKIPHDWVVRSVTTQEEFDRHAKLPLIPLVISPDGTSQQDSTPIIETFEARFPEPSIHPSDAALGFLSALLEEYADEWGNKPMFHYRWTYPADQDSAGERIARSMNPALDEGGLTQLREVVKARMVPRLSLVGSCEATRDAIEGSFLRVISLLERHLARRPYLFGGRPSFGDFGLYAQLYECSIDPTPGAILRANAPGVLRWIDRMLDPKADGDFETWDAVRDTLLPLLRDEIGAVFFPWTLANADAIQAGRKTFSVTLGGVPFEQETQKYHAKSLAALRARYAKIAHRAHLDAILREAGCLDFLRE